MNIERGETMHRTLARARATCTITLLAGAILAGTMLAGCGSSAPTATSLSAQVNKVCEETIQATTTRIRTARPLMSPEAMTAAMGSAMHTAATRFQTLKAPTELRAPLAAYTARIKSYGDYFAEYSNALSTHNTRTIALLAKQGAPRALPTANLENQLHLTHCLPGHRGG